MNFTKWASVSAFVALALLPGCAASAGESIDPGDAETAYFDFVDEVFEKNDTPAMIQVAEGICMALIDEGHSEAVIARTIKESDATLTDSEVEQLVRLAKAFKCPETL